jgi:hypothetical protein
MAMDPPKKFLSCILQAAEQWEREDWELRWWMRLVSKDLKSLDTEVDLVHGGVEWRRTIHIN